MQSFTVYGEPQGKGRARSSSVGGRIIVRTPAQTVLYENLVKTEYRAQCGDYRFPDKTPLSLLITAYYQTPRSASKKDLTAMARGDMLPTKKPDADNVLKIVADSLNGIAYRDDAQIAVAVISKAYTLDNPRVTVALSAVQPPAKEA